MGLTAQWLGVRAPAGWSFRIFASDELRKPAELDELAAGAETPALGAFVFDSDFAYVVAAAERVVAAQLLFNPAAAAEYGAEPPAEVREAMPRAFSTWAELHAPRAMPPEEVQRLLAEDWVLAEEAIEELLARIGLELPFPDVPPEGQTRSMAWAPTLHPGEPRQVALLLVQRAADSFDLYTLYERGDYGTSSGLSKLQVELMRGVPQWAVEWRSVPEEFGDAGSAIAWVREQVG